MKLLEVTSNHRHRLNEAKARIDHPEDIMFDQNGVNGAKGALAAMMHAADSHADTTTIKWDGSPAVIFGWMDKTTFVVTDKAGIGAKKYDGRPASAADVSSMIYNRRPDQIGRAEYAAHFGGLYDLLKAATPKSLMGVMIQGDMLWMKASDVATTEDSVDFKPNKIQYHIGKSTELGTRIAASSAGIAIHGQYDSVDAAASAAAEPSPATPQQLGMKQTRGLVILGPQTQITASTKIKLPAADIKKAQALINSASAAQIDDMMDPFAIGALKISNLADVFKSYINFNARSGKEIVNGSAAAQDFVNWVKTSSGLTANKQQNVLTHIDQFKSAFRTAWDIVAVLTVIKHKIKGQLDQAVGSNQNLIQTRGGHEGFVSATPYGKIKLVNRQEFMKNA